MTEVLILHAGWSVLQNTGTRCLGALKNHVVGIFPGEDELVGCYDFFRINSISSRY